MSNPLDAFRKERDELAIKYFDNWSGGDAPSFRDGWDACLDSSLIKSLVEALEAISTGSVYVDRGNGKTPKTRARQALANFNLVKQDLEK